MGKTHRVDWVDIGIEHSRWDQPVKVFFYSQAHVRTVAPEAKEPPDGGEMNENLTPAPDAKVTS